jgi:ABC-type branched-subunit amino acid transport system substrate-binding protein
MTMRLRAFVSLALGLALSHAILAHADIVVGQSLPLTGEAGAAGRGLALGSKIYFDHVNATEGGVNGQKIVQVVKDDAYKPENTLRNVKDFVADPHVVALTGLYGTDNVSELLRQGVFDGATPPVVGVSTGARLLREPLNPSIFHLRASYVEEVEAIVRHVTSLGTKRIAVFYEDNPFGEAGLRAAEDAAKKRNVALVARASYEPYTTDVRNAVKDVIESNPDTVIMVSITPPTAEFIQQFHAAGGQAFLFCISTANVEGLARTVAPPVLQGVGMSQVMPFPYSATLPLVAEYQKLMNTYAKGTPYSYPTMEGFLNAKLLVTALKKAGAAPTRASVRQALDNLGQVNLGGYTLSFSPNNHIGSHFVDLTVVSRTGKLMR